MDMVAIPRDVLERLYSCAMFAPITTQRFDALSVARIALDAPPSAPAGLLVSRPVLVAVRDHLANHRDNCDIQSAAAHAEISAACFHMAAALRGDGNA